MPATKSASEEVVGDNLTPNEQIKAEEEQANISPEFKRKIKEKYNYRCIKCGALGPHANQEPDIAHIDHQGIGGDPSKNTEDNLLPLCRDCHIDHHQHKFTIKEWNPNDLKDGLKIHSVEEDRDLNKNEIYFYQMPIPELAEEASKTMRKLEAQVKKEKNTIWNKIKHVYDLKYGTVMGRKKFKGRPRSDNEGSATYSQWNTFAKQELANGQIRDSWQKVSTIDQQVSAYKSMVDSELFDDQELDNLTMPVGNAKILQSVLNNDEISTEKKKRLKADAYELSQSELKRRKKTLLSGEDPNKTLVTCGDCAVPHPKEVDKVYTEDGEEIKLGSRDIQFCPISKYAVNKMTASEKRNVGQDFNERKNCFEEK